jgi:signal transduction histidine kinase
MSEGMGLKRLGQEANASAGVSAFSLYRDEPKMLYNIHRALNGESFTDFTESSQGIQFQTHFHSIYDPQGQFDGVVAVTIDLSERMHLEQNRLDLALERERINLLQRFMGDVSHDFKTPLTSIMLSVHLLSKASRQEDRQRHLEVIAMQTDRLEKFMTDLFNMSRFDKGATNEFNFGRVHVNDLVKDVIASHQPLLQEKSHALRWEPDEMVTIVLGDQFQLDRVVTNLLVNAIHYTPRGGQIVLRSRQEDRWAVIEVQDNGLGIAPEDHERIFHRFYRGDPARSSDQGGMGVGLAIARKIIEAHGGKITVESMPNQGSTFRVFIPMLGARS